MAADDRRRSERARRVRAVKRDIIVEAARRVFESNGLDGASMRLIAAEAGCTTGAIYPYFTGKEEIYAAILSQSLADLTTFIDAATSDPTLSPTGRARAAAMAFHAYYANRPGELSLGLYLFRQTGLKPAGLSPALNDRLNAELVTVVDRITRAIAQAGFDQPRALAIEATSHAVGLVIMRETGRLRLFGADAEAMMHAFVERMLIAPPPEAVSRSD